MLLMGKLKNGLKDNGNYEYYLHNVSINGAKRGCAGMIKNLDNEVVVYVNTEKLQYHPLKEKNLVRYAKHTKDWTGCRNIWVTDEEICKKIASMLDDKETWESEKNFW